VFTQFIDNLVGIDIVGDEAIDIDYKQNKYNVLNKNF
jgi:hypothetical protein